MPLFQKSVLNKYLKAQDRKAIDDAFKIFSAHFLNAKMQQEIKDMKEEEYQDGFLDDLFVKVLGYTKRPNEGYNLIREKKNETDGKKADGAILKNDSPLAVIELKGTDTTDLDKVTSQAFGYKNNHPDCTYVVTSNFEKLRFFIQNAVEHLEFNLFKLTKEEFSVLWLCLQSGNLLADIPFNAKQESIVEEEAITKQLYKDYTAFKNELWQNVCKNDPDKDPLLLFKKTQKLLDRFLFIFFAEDSGLLPPNSITRMVERYEQLIELDAQKPLYEIFKQYFGYINIGRKGKSPQDDIYAYNGGLFFEDDVIDNFIIDDDLLKKHVLKLTAYDFQSDVDVNILGHIFENSLNEIENVTAMLEGQEVDKSKSKRKKDGVYYTPKYITKYIVDNTVGNLCEEKKAELGVIDEEYAKGRRNRHAATIKKLDIALQKYREWLLNITICDPACGSGAFLNQALEFLIEEHTYIDELHAELMGASIVFQDVSTHILEKNIFGVDINEESVEIAKLSLWLRTAQKGRKLTTLSGNIKCGNSLIDDPAVAGVKAFNWKKGFSDVFKKGGFDVIIGNPPYIRAELLPKIHKSYYETNMFSPFKQFDIYILFYEKGIEILKGNGLLGYITPNKFFVSDYGKKIREYILNRTSIIKIADVSMMKIFPEASVYPALVTLKKFTLTNNKIFINQNVLSPNALDSLGTPINQNAFLDTEDYIINTNISNIDILNKIDQIGSPIGEQYKITRGFRPPKEDLIGNKTSKGYYPYLIGSSLSIAYGVQWNGKTVKYLPDQIPESKPVDTFIQPKVLIRDIGLKFNAYFDCSNYLCLKTIYFVYGGSENSLKFLTGLLNSRLINFYFKEKYSTMHISGGYLRFRKQFIEKVPVILFKNTKEHVFFVEIVDKIIARTEKLLQIHSNFRLLLQNKFDFNFNKLSQRLQDWYELGFADFLKELKKAKVQLTLSEEAEWMQYFNEQKHKAQELKSEIDRIDKDIDQMVYQLYGLTEEEIAIVENAVK